VSDINEEALLELISQTMAAGTLYFAENRGRIQRGIFLDPDAHTKPYYHQFLEEAKAFIRYRPDLIEALTEEDGKSE
jgi:hypothetical protein